MRRFLLLVPLVVIFAVAGVALFRVRPAAVVGKPAPEFSLPVLDHPDQVISTSDLRGKPAVINFWASWCEPCKDEAPELARAAKLHDDIEFLGITMLDGRESAQRFVDRYGIGYRSIRDARGVIAKRYGVTGVPETVFLDADGNVAGTYIGAFDRATLARLLDQLEGLRPGERLRITGSGETRPVP